VRRREATGRRYAKALFSLAREAERVDAVGSELEQFHRILTAEPRLGEFLARAWITGAAKQAVVAELAGRLESSTLVRDFLGLLAARGRMNHLPEIAQAYGDLVDRERGRVRARVRTAVALTAAGRGRLGECLGRLVGRDVLLEEDVDPALLGGFVAEIGSLVLDGSLAGQLRRVRTHLVRG
jgi:F-type H+-transporting ATPase subunit delta